MTRCLARSMSGRPGSTVTHHVPHQAGIFMVSSRRRRTGDACQWQLGFACSSPEQVHAWHAAGVANGGKPIEDPPGVQEGGGRLPRTRDLDGSKIRDASDGLTTGTS